MELDTVERFFDKHRFVVRFDKVSESPKSARYTLHTPLEGYEQYMFDYDWLEILEIRTWRCPSEKLLGSEETADPTLTQRILMKLSGTVTLPALGFVVEVKK